MDVHDLSHVNRNGASEKPPPSAAGPAEDTESAAALPSASGRRRRLTLGSLLGGIVLGSLASLLVFAALLLMRQQESLPPLTRQAYEAAMRRWQTSGPASYALDLTLLGRQPGQIHIEVHQGDVTAMTRDGIQPRQRRTWDYWSVPGQFDTIERELEMAAHPEASFHAPAGAVVQQAEFDPRYGYPRRYRRFVLGTELEIDWQVTHFEPLR
jgi:hypothetical protein